MAGEAAGVLGQTASALGRGKSRPDGRPQQRPPDDGQDQRRDDAPSRENPGAGDAAVPAHLLHAATDGYPALAGLGLTPVTSTPFMPPRSMTTPVTVTVFPAIPLSWL